MKKFIIVFSLLLLVVNPLNGAGFFETLLEGEDAQRVKNGKLKSCPQMTLLEMAEGFMGSPSWSTITADDGFLYVNLEGEISYHNKPVDALIQFKLNNDNTFEYRAMEFNGVPQSKFFAFTLLEKMCSKEPDTSSTNSNEKIINLKNSQNKLKSWGTISKELGYSSVKQMINHHKKSNNWSKYKEIFNNPGKFNSIYLLKR